MTRIARTFGVLSLLAAATVGLSACGTSSASDQRLSTLETRVTSAEQSAQRAQQAAQQAQQSAAAAQASAERVERMFQTQQRK